MPLFLKMESCFQGCYILLKLTPFPVDAETLPEVIHICVLREGAGGRWRRDVIKSAF